MPRVKRSSKHLLWGVGRPRGKQLGQGIQEDGSLWLSSGGSGVSGGGQEAMFAVEPGKQASNSLLITPLITPPAPPRFAPRRLKTYTLFLQPFVYTLSLKP